MGQCKRVAATKDGERITVQYITEHLISSLVIARWICCGMTVGKPHSTQQISKSLQMLAKLRLEAVLPKEM